MNPAVKLCPLTGLTIGLAQPIIPTGGRRPREVYHNVFCFSRFGCHVRHSRKLFLLGVLCVVLFRSLAIDES